MILYHGSNTEIMDIDLSLCRPFKDFGKGFYTTALPQQAHDMAVRVSRIYGGEPIVNVFEISDGFMDSEELNIKDFGDLPSDEWALFVMNNRDNRFKDHSDPCCNHDCKYDIVRGIVADDTMTVLFNLYTKKIVPFEYLVKELTFKKTTNQYSFHTQRAVDLLKKVGVQ